MANIQHLQKSLSSHTKKKTYALSSTQILDLLVSIAEKAKKDFDVKILYDPNFIHNSIKVNETTFCPHEGSYGDFIYQTMESLGIETQMIPGKYQPPFGFVRKHENKGKMQEYKKANLEKGLDHLVIVEDGLFERTDEQDLLGVEYYIDFPWSSMDGYFVESWLPGWFEELGFPTRAVPMLSKLYARLERLRGKKELDKTAAEIQALCKQINPADVSIIDYAQQEGDLFSYNNHLFYFRRSTNANKLSGINTTHNFRDLKLYWMYVLYNRTLEKPIGYRSLKIEYRKRIETKGKNY